MPTFGKAELRNLAKVISSGTFCDKRGGYMDQFRDDFAKALRSRHAISGATAMLLMQAIPGAIGAGARSDRHGRKIGETRSGHESETFSALAYSARRAAMGSRSAARVAG